MCFAITPGNTTSPSHLLLLIHITFPRRDGGYCGLVVCAYKSLLHSQRNQDPKFREKSGNSRITEVLPTKRIIN